MRPIQYTDLIKLVTLILLSPICYISWANSLATLSN